MKSVKSMVNSVVGASFSLSLVLALCASLIAQAGLAAIGDPAVGARKIFEDAQMRYEKEPRNAEAAWQFARACFDLADLATNNAQRIEVAEKGTAACKQLLSRDPRSAPGHYYLGMNLGQVAQTRGIGALKLVTEMEEEFDAARDLDNAFDYGGPDRNLGLLYRDAPAMISIGSRIRAKKHLQRAVELAPNYPENRLNLIEAYLKWNERNAAHNELKALEELLPRARSTFAGKAWEASWTDWEERLRKIRKKLEEPDKTIPSPRQKG
jgi:tetratricopeptide (TPR) repeat protein